MEALPKRWQIFTQNACMMKPDIVMTARGCLKHFRAQDAMNSTSAATKEPKAKVKVAESRQIPSPTIKPSDNYQLAEMLQQLLQ